MPDAPVISRAAQGSRLAAALVVVIGAAAAKQVWQAEQRSAALRDEVAGFRTRLADRRELIARQRREMAQVGRAMTPGTDIATEYALPGTAAGNGEVFFAGPHPGYGGLVIVDHGGRLDTLYGHLSALYVREGQQVHRGQAIGAVGATGRATGAHLHYEVRVNGAPVDPRRYLGK